MEKDYIGRNKDYIGYKKEDHALGDFFFFLKNADGEFTPVRDKK